ncbi:hypothetical protein DSL72_006389 [Monilinia vaccinii-corymbosi]|uniref:Uncharacterized protein n=1 Tax=Monilinia vaccinii-corymbosi TaxID=61207 RepID=A0A8A3PNL1_9HELO|nr:hypothetical protein DSL72_006389 [Monilinia vaccinii-corymbosi]
MVKNIKASMGRRSWRSTPKSWGTPAKPEGKERSVKKWRIKAWGVKKWGSQQGVQQWDIKVCDLEKSANGDKRDATLLIIILRHRLTPPVPYALITEIIISISPDTYPNLCRNNCELKGLTKEQQYNWFASWCKEMERKEIMKGGGRWVAAVNWENERVRQLYACLEKQLQGRGPVFGLVGEEGVNELKLQVGQKKEFIKQNKTLKEKEEAIRAKENQSTLQEDWFANNDCMYKLKWSKGMQEDTDECIIGRCGSVPDLTILKPKSIIGQGYPFGDFLRPLDEDALSWNSDSDMGSTISANSTHSSSSNLTTWPNPSAITHPTLPPWCAD